MLCRFRSFINILGRTVFFLLPLFGYLTVFQAAALAENLVMIEFTSQNCQACRQMEPLVQQLITKGYPIRQVDADKEAQLAEQLGVTALPTFVVLSDGKFIERIEAVADGFSMEQRLQSLFEKNREFHPIIRQTEPQPVRSQPVTAYQSPQTIPWLQATVRIRVESPNGCDWGTGTMIDARGGEVLILTCGHIFRDSKGLGQIEVDLFCGNTPKRVPGVCLKYEADNLDLGLVKIAPQFSVDVIPVAPLGTELCQGMTLLSTGCDNGANPTIREHRVQSLTNVAPYIGAPFHYVQVDNAPVQGRSGGGLFTKNGLLVGVCVAASNEDNEGLFVPAAFIRRELDNAKLSCVYQTPSITRSQSSPVVLASNETRMQNAAPQPVPTANNAISQPIFIEETNKPNMIQPGFVSSTVPIATPTLPPPANDWSDQPQPLTLRPLAYTETRLSDRDIATLEELQRRQQEGDEIIVIVRSKKNPEQPCEVIQLSDVSPEFLEALTGVQTTVQTNTTILRPLP